MYTSLMLEERISRGVQITDETGKVDAQATATERQETENARWETLAELSRRSREQIKAGMGNSDLLPGLTSQQFQDKLMRTIRGVISNKWGEGTDYATLSDAQKNAAFREANDIVFYDILDNLAQSNAAQQPKLPPLEPQLQQPFKHLGNVQTGGSIPSLIARGEDLFSLSNLPQKLSDAPTKLPPEKPFPHINEI